MADNAAWLGGKRATEEHWIPLADLMTGLMMIFMLISVISMQQMEAKRNAIRAVAQQYTSTRQDLYQDLQAKLGPDLQRWHAKLAPDLTVRFDEPNVLFATGQSALKDSFKRILDEFFPRYIAIIGAPKYRDSIKEVRIEGHTSSQWQGAASLDDAYFHNMELSQSRTRSTLEYVLLLPQVAGEKAWLTQKLTANGLSSSQTLKNADGSEDVEGSQRVEFRVRTDADARLDEILKAGK
jgi:outer membrane protein OmpA-like peptidoglycan-associated protein